MGDNYIPKLSIFFALVLIVFSCNDGTDIKSSIELEDDVIQKKDSPNLIEGTDPELNITILLDLSDRLERNLQPDQMQRDIAIVSSITELFKTDMNTKGAYMAKGKLKVLFRPTPKDPNINQLASTLNVDLSRLNNQEKKDIYDNITTNFTNSLGEIYDLTIDSKNWIGCDIWRFFKNDAADLCVESSGNYKNILIICTDGYIFHEQSRDRIDKRSAYITEKYLTNEGFHGTQDWRTKFESNDYGLIKFDQDLDNLEVIVLEVNSAEKHKNDEDILKAYWGKWFEEIGINRFELYNTDLPANTKIRLNKFFRE
ncbi:MAG: hypothetical protein ACI8Q1_002212 [Parvicella sp.]|jgi:hypothetical protein